MPRSNPDGRLTGDDIMIRYAHTGPAAARRFTATALLTAAFAGTLASTSANASAQEGPRTFRACYVPEVGAMYVLDLPGLPAECLSSEHEEISWMEGEPIARGSIDTEDLADGAVTTAKIADGAVTTPKIAANAITSAEIQDGTVQAADLAFDAIGVPGYELFEESTTFGSPMEAGSFFTLGRVCPDGKMALGGGDSSQFAVVIHASRPHGNGRGWTVDFHNTSDLDLDIEYTIHIVCADVE